MARDESRPGFRFDDEARRKRGSRISSMFDRIAPTYDFLNHLLSANLDRAWRKDVVRRLALTGGERCLDACCGTGDLALALVEGGAGAVVASDFAPAMVARAREKLGDRATVLVADTTRLPFPDAGFDVATVGFGVRNLEDLGAGLSELHRVLRPGGRLAILEFSRPGNPLLRGVYHLYFLLVLPLIGNLVSGGAQNAYAYLPRSVLAFPPPDVLSARLRAAGFSSVTATPIAAGIAHLHLATR